MKDKNLPNDYSSLSLEELTDRANMMIKDLEKEKNLDLILAENQKVKDQKNIEELKEAYNLMKLIYQKYYKQA